MAGLISKFLDVQSQNALQLKRLGEALKKWHEIATTPHCKKKWNMNDWFLWRQDTAMSRIEPTDQRVNQWTVILMGNRIGQTWLDGDRMTFVSDENIRHPHVKVNGLTHPPFSLFPFLFFSLYNGCHCFSIQTEDLIGLSLCARLWKAQRKKKRKNLHDATLPFKSVELFLRF